MIRFVVLLLLAGSTAFAQSDFDRTFPVSSSPDLYVSTGSGSIHLYPGDNSQIHITAHLHADWNAGGDVQERIRRIAAHPPIEVTGNSIKVGDLRGEDAALYRDITIDYQIAAPVNVAVNLHSGSGDLRLDNLGRFAKLDSGSGSLRLHGLAGPADLHTGSGDIDLQERGPGDVHAVSGSGSVRVSGLAGGLQLRSGSGDLDVSGRLSGPADLHTGSGSIRMHLGRDARFNVEASVGSGSIHLSQPGAPRQTDEAHHVNGPVNGGGPTLKATTGSGDISID